MTFDLFTIFIPSMLNNLEKMIVAAIQGDMPLCRRPYLEIANRLGIKEDLLLKTLNNLCERGVIRRFGATLRHQKSGYSANAMVAWQVEEDKVEKVGGIMATFIEVSHCYRRDPDEDWPYNLYTMVHAKDEASCREIAGKISSKTGVNNFTLLFSRREFKKTSMEYFNHGN